MKTSAFASLLLLLFTLSGKAVVEPHYARVGSNAYTPPAGKIFLIEQISSFWNGSSTINSFTLRIGVSNGGTNFYYFRYYPEINGDTVELKRPLRLADNMSIRLHQVNTESVSGNVDLAGLLVDPSDLYAVLPMEPTDQQVAGGEFRSEWEAASARPVIPRGQYSEDLMSWKDIVRSAMQRSLDPSDWTVTVPVEDTDSRGFVRLEGVSRLSEDNG